MPRFLLPGLTALPLLLAAQAATADGLERVKLDMGSFSKSQLETLAKEVKYIAYWDSYAHFCGADLSFEQRARAAAAPCLTQAAMDAIARLYEAAKSDASGAITKSIKAPNEAFCALVNQSTRRSYISEAKALIEGKLRTMALMCRSCLWCGKD